MMKRTQQGFSLVELMMVLVVLTIVMGVIFQQIIAMQQRYKTEEVRQDLFSEAREFVDQFARDVHESGYPHQKIYANGVLGANPEVDGRLAVGIVHAGPTEFWMEGDVDGDGQVDSVRYSLVAVNGSCPCTLQRSQVVKVPNLDAWKQPAVFNTEVQGVANSLGINGGAPLLIAGQTSRPGVGVINDDAYFATLKAPAVFQYYDGNGAQVNANTDISNGGGQAVIMNIRTVRIVLNLVASSPDPRTGLKPYVTLGAIAKLPNCSIYATNQTPPVPGC
jgi:prepilin-type N-terminal cleavage/methylation domain-containing protein